MEQFEVVGVRTSRVTNTGVMMVGAARRRVRRNEVVRVGGNGTRVPGRWQRRREGRYNRVGGMVSQTMGTKGEGRYPFMYTRVRYVLARNRRGLIPYGFTVTSHLAVTRTLAMGVWIGKRRVGLRRHGRKRRGRFLPAGTPFGMIPMMVPLERRGYTITVVSLSVRLFANMMAGHILLKVIGGFAWTMMGAGGRRYLGHFRPRIVLFRLRILETGVAFVQAYVFGLLTAIYMTDSFEGGH